MSDEKTTSVWGMSDVVELLTQIRDSLSNIDEHLEVISGDTKDIHEEVKKSAGALLQAIDVVGEKVDSASTEISGMIASSD